jgi:putative hemolysin
MNPESAQLIDLDEIIRQRAGKKAKYIPRFVVGLLKRLVHQDFVNGILKEGYDGVEFCREGLKYLDVTIQVEGRENLPDRSGRYTFVSNHPLGAIDGVGLGYILGEHYDGKIKYLVNDLLLNLHGLRSISIPINKVGHQGRSLPQMVDNAFMSDNQIIMFPAGLCSRKRKGVIRDIPWSKAFIKKSVATKRDVVPIHFIGANSNHFYRFANICKMLHLKFNFAMLLLPDEMYRNRHRSYTVRIGKPIPWQTFDASKTPAEWAQYVEKTVYTI